MTRRPIAVAALLALSLIAPTFYAAAMPCCRKSAAAPASPSHCHAMEIEADGSASPSSLLQAANGCDASHGCCVLAAHVANALIPSPVALEPSPAFAIHAHSLKATASLPGGHDTAVRAPPSEALFG